MATSSVHAFVLGEHGDSQIVAWSSGTVGGTPLLEIPEIQKLDREKLAKEVANKAYQIIKAKVDWVLTRSISPITPDHLT